MFDIKTFFIGLVIMLAGGSMVVFHRWIADNFVGGVSGYDKVKFWGIIGCILGFIIMLNIHYSLLSFLVGSIFNK